MFQSSLLELPLKYFVNSDFAGKSQCKFRVLSQIDLLRTLLFHNIDVISNLYGNWVLYHLRPIIVDFFDS